MFILCMLWRSRRVVKRVLGQFLKKLNLRKLSRGNKISIAVLSSQTVSAAEI